MSIEKALSLLHEIKNFVMMEFETVGQKFPEDWEMAIDLISKTLSNPGNYFFETIYLNKQKEKGGLVK